MDGSPRSLAARLLAWARRHRVALLVAAGIVALRGVLPFGLARVAEWQGERLLGRVVQVGNVDLSLLGGGLVVERAVLGPILRAGEPRSGPGSEGALLGWSRLEADIEWWELLGGTLHLSRVRLVDPELRLVVDRDGRLVPLLAAADEPAEEAPGDEPSEGAGLPVVLDALEIENAALVLVDLALPGVQPLELRFDELALGELALGDGALSVGEVDLSGPRLRLRRDIDLSAFQGEPAPDAEGAVEDAPAAPPLAIRIREIDVEGAELLLLAGDLELASTLRFSADDVVLDEPFAFEFHLGIEEGFLEGTGRAGASPPSFDGTVRWEALPLGRLAQAAAVLPVGIESGESAGELAVKTVHGDGTAAGAAGVTLNGRVEVSGVAAAVPPANGQEIELSWSRLRVVLDEATLAPDGAKAPRVALGEVLLEAPRLKLLRAEGGAPVDEAAGAAPADVPGEEAAPAGGPEDEAPAPTVTLARLEVVDGEIDFRDETVTPALRSVARPFALRASDLHWPGPRVGALKVEAKSPGAVTSVALDARFDGARGEASLAVDSLALGPWSAYVARAAGYRIEDGRLNVDARVEVDPERIEVDGDLEALRLGISELEPGIFEKQFGLSLDLALALLRDPFGNIAFPVPATIDRSEAGRGGVSLAPIVAAVLRQAIIGALSSPIKGLGMVVRAGRGVLGTSLRPVALDPGNVEAGPGAEEQLAAVARLLDERPGLAVVAQGRAGAADDPFLAEAILIEGIREGAELPPVGAGFLQKRRLRGALEQRGEGGRGELEPEDAAVLRDWIAAVEVPEARRRALADARAEALRERLESGYGVDPERVGVGPALEGDPGVVVELAPASP
jgi:hypothetical protein